MVGVGILKGLTETALNFFGSYVRKDRLTTIQFPEERAPRIEATRNFPFLVYDGDDAMAGLLLHLRKGMPAQVHPDRQKHR